MTEVRRPLVALIVLYAGAVTIDRVGDQALAWWVFVLGALVVTALLGRAGFRESRPATVAGASLLPFLVAKVLSPGGQGPLGSDVYLAVTEAAFIVLLALLAQRLASGLAAVDDALASVAFGENPALPLSGPQAGNEILTEMARSRRHERPLSVTVLAPDPASFDVAVDRAADEVHRTIRSRYVRGNLARLIAQQLRRSDVLFEDAGTGHFLVLSPETDDAGASLLTERIGRAADAAGLKLESGSASFPQQAVSFEQLVEMAERRLAGDDTIPPRLRAITGAPGGEQ